MQKYKDGRIELSAEEFLAVMSGNKKGEAEYDIFYRAYSFSEDAVVFANVVLKEKLTVFKGGEATLDVFIISGEFFAEFNLTDYTFIKEFRIDDGTFHKMFGTGGCTFKKGFTLKGGAFKQDFCVFDGEFNRFHIENGVFEDNVRIFGGTFNDEFKVDYGTFLKGFKIESGTFNDTFSVHGGEFHDFIIENGDFKKSVWVEGGNFKTDFSLEGGSFDRVFVQSSNELKIEKLKFSFKQNPVKLVKLTNSDDQFTINSLEFTDTILAKDAIVQLEKIKVKSLKFSSTHNYGNMSFTQVRSKSVGGDYDLSFLNSDMGKTTIIDSDLSNFNFHFQSSKITEVFITGTILPEVIKPTQEQHGDKVLLREQQRLGYGQLKKIYDSRGDVVTSNMYFSKEMNAYYEMLSWKLHTWEKINLGLNKFSTNHGQSWKRGLFTTLLLSASLYLLYAWLLGYRSFSFTRIGFSRFSLLWSYFFEYINPIHKADYIADQLAVRVSEWARMVEALSRIVTGYLIYQFIQAFRKHGKK